MTQKEKNKGKPQKNDFYNKLCKLTLIYYHRENGEYWVNVQLSDTCLFAGEEYEQQKKKAKTHGTQELFKYLSIPYDHDQSIVDNFVNGLISQKLFIGFKSS